jgi:hypothetical protein
MKNLIRFYGFGYGCLGTLCALVWYSAAILNGTVIPSNWSIVVTIFTFHAIAGLVTFDRTPVHPAWQPIVSITPGRIRLAKILLGLATLNFAVCMGTLIVATLGERTALEDKMVYLVLTSFLLQNTTYIALHWAFRPENLFSASFLRVIANPLGELFSNNKNRN